jgi:hypothetical protein
MEVVRDQGLGDIDFKASLAETQLATHPRRQFVPCFCRVHFARIQASGTDTAVFLLRVGNEEPAFDTQVWRVAAAGVGADVNLRWHPAWRKGWALSPGQSFHVTWTNPDSDDILWGLEFGLEYYDVA